MDGQADSKTSSLEQQKAKKGDTQEISPSSWPLKRTKSAVLVDAGDEIQE